MAFKLPTTGWGLSLLLLTPITLAAGGTGDEALSLEFLEFLGEWEDEQGNWQNPLEYEDPETALNAKFPDVNVEQNNEEP